MTLDKSYSLLSFNERVLTQGKVDPNEDYSYSDLKKLLFFNKVFISNIREMFSKGLYKSKYDKYLMTLMTQYHSNISCILNIINNYHTGAKASRKATTPTITSNVRIEMKLEVEKVIHSQMISTRNADVKKLFNAVTNSGLYFISKNGNEFNMGFIDPKHSIFASPIGCNLSSGRIYCKTDKAIMEWLKNFNDDVSSMYITTYMNSDKIALIECSSKPGYIPKGVTWIPNSYQYIDDIEQILNILSPETPVEKSPDFKPIRIEEVWDHDILIEYPRDTFDEFLQFIAQTIRSDVYVDEIDITLYRIGSDPTLFYLLTEAAKKGIAVHANVELCASGEDINQFWFEELKRSGVNVYAYKTGELKVHSKLALIKFANNKMMCHIGTGNYHTKTTSQYTDLSLITVDQEICESVMTIFDILKGNIVDMPFCDDTVLVTQYNAREALSGLILSEAAKGKDGLIIIKCNSLSDDDIIDDLQTAADAGCTIRLIVRGICTWVPNEITDNITIKSVIWDKLEHSRVFAFGKVDPDIYIGSLDLVTSKLDKRIETMVRIQEPEIAMDIIRYLNRYITTTDGSWKMMQDGTYLKL